MGQVIKFAKLKKYPIDRSEDKIKKIFLARNGGTHVRSQILQEAVARESQISRPALVT